MSESQLAAYANIATQKVPPAEDYDPTKGLIDRLQLLAVKPQPEFSVIEDRKEKPRGIIHQGKKSPEDMAEKARIDAETRAMFATMKEEHIAKLPEGVKPDFEIAANRGSREVLRQLPSFLQKIAMRKDMPPQLSEKLISYAIDKGISMEHTFQEKVARGTEMLNRSAFSNFVKKDHERRFEDLRWKYAAEKVRKSEAQLQSEVDAMYAFQLLDIKDFRASDFAKDKEGSHGADYTINKVGVRVNTLVGNINNIFATQKIDAMVSLCRYGGDEIGLAFLNVPPELRKIIYAAVAGLKMEDERK